MIQRFNAIMDAEIDPRDLFFLNDYEIKQIAQDTALQIREKARVNELSLAAIESGDIMAESWRQAVRNMP